MKTIMTSSQKGGSGKTTMALNLAVAAAKDGNRVIAFDLDPQQSLRAWWQARDTDDIQMLDQDPPVADIRQFLKHAEGQGFDIAIVDTPPAAGDWLRAAMAEADLVAVPVKPTPADLRAIGRTIDIINASQPPFAFFLSQTKPGTKVVNETARVLAKHGRVADTEMTYRVSHATGEMNGTGAIEGDDKKAAAEFAAIWTYVKEITS
ncbi:cobyrinic acid a,c-diamide synthase [Roseivivax marinus]|uniref:Cobyrinic acid a,c-diamide synthase n=1 Tax=Roseivivax marinus TaxID=1379903 RepID=W4HF43_9RHOB|nr:ParA family protein [Roseivivax marinus]ETW11013.1 cobyrinic acid a,c-diamide synthase [Roseivivax marinus]